MIRRLFKLLARLERLFGTSPGNGSRSHLVGMYLSHANRVSGASARGFENQERQNGKFAQTRRRG
jgi:hypothetical protein